MNASTTSELQSVPRSAVKRPSLTEVARWLLRPPHAQAVHLLRTALERRDVGRLTALLDPDVAVVVHVGDAESRAIKWVSGIPDAVALLTQGLAKPGIAIAERTVNGQAGLLFVDSQHEAALVAVDYTKGLVSMIWVRVDPVLLRHGNAV